MYRIGYRKMFDISNPKFHWMTIIFWVTTWMIVFGWIFHSSIWHKDFSVPILIWRIHYCYFEFRYHNPTWNTFDLFMCKLVQMLCWHTSKLPVSQWLSCKLWTRLFKIHSQIWSAQILKHNLKLFMMPNPLPNRSRKTY